ncbi:MAG TPA: hypothetical protein VFG75_03390 [Gaiella sp.]|nr:hypothetical protein [Gaiella sp.]
MARSASRERRPLPPPLPPVSRTVGQVVAQGIELYQRNFYRALLLGLPIAVVDQLVTGLSIPEKSLALVVASPFFSLAYAGACAIRQTEKPPRRVWALAVALGVLTFLPAALLFPWFAILSVLWLGLAGHAVPIVMAERLGPVEALRRTLVLGRADYIHAAGSFATLAILFAITRYALGLLLASQADAAVRVAIFLADLVMSPLLFLGASIVYVDLVARVGLSREERRRLRVGVTGQAK